MLEVDRRQLKNIGLNNSDVGWQRNRDLAGIHAYHQAAFSYNPRTVLQPRPWMASQVENPLSRLQQLDAPVNFFQFVN
jgi:hypothetical protein